MMNLHVFRPLLALLLFALAAPAAAAATGREVTNFDRAWQFHLGDPDGAEAAGFNDAGWRTLDVPHDWSIEGEHDESHPMGRRGGYLPAGIGWYRKTFELPADWSDKRVRVEFDGVYHQSDVWINGHHLGFRPYGYGSFAYDLTDHLVDGENTIAVRVDHEDVPSGRWYTGSGIYRHVRLVATDPVSVAHWGTYVTTPEVGDDRATVRLETTVDNAGDAEAEVVVRTTLLDPDGEPVAVETADAVAVEAGGSGTVAQTLAVYDPLRWSLDTPNLYRAVTEVRVGGEPRDRYETTFGIRTIEFSHEFGFKLNGVRMKIQGVNLHHDGGPVGAAVPADVLERRLRLLKEMGTHAIRTGHTPLAPEFYAMCDRLGLMVMDEAFDGWENEKAKFDFGLHFEEWGERELADLVRRDRNHPSVILWSIGNEVKGPDLDTQRRLVKLVHELDPTRPVTQGDAGAIVGRGEKSFEKNPLDIPGLNGKAELKGIYERIDAALKETQTPKPVLATEVPHTYHTRGVYMSQTTWRTRDFPGAWEEGKDWDPAMENVFPIPDLSESEVFPEDYANVEHRQSSYDNAIARVTARRSWQRATEFDWIPGQFIWLSFDYLGESYKWPARMHSSGVLDLMGFKKDHFYLYQSLWTDEPMVHVLPHWTHPGKEGAEIPVVAYTNAERVELFLNDESLGEQAYEGEQLVWQVPFEPGTLRAVARSGEFVVAEDVVRTAGEPAAVRAVPDRTALRANNADCVHLTLEIIDAEGVVHPYGDAEVTLEIDGPIEMIGIDNGDPLDLDSYKEPQRKAFRGKLMAILQATDEPGEVTVTARADGLEAATVRLQVLPQDQKTEDQ